MTLSRLLSEPRSLWLSFTVTLVITIAFQVIIGQLDLTLLDTITEPSEVRLAITAMSDYQRHFHAWMTGTLDVAYPAAYAALFVGTAYRFFPSRGCLLSLPAIACAVIDLSEGVVQILALTNSIDWLAAKAILTPMKQLLFVSGFLITLAGWISWVVDRVRVKN